MAARHQVSEPKRRHVINHGFARAEHDRLYFSNESGFVGESHADPLVRALDHLLHLGHGFRVARHLVDGCVLVSVDEICAATRDVFYENRAVPEPAGALALAGLKRWVHEQGAKDLSLAAIVSGANLNFDRLRHIAERAELGDEAEGLFAVTIPERPGSFRELCELLGKRSTMSIVTAGEVIARLTGQSRISAPCSRRQ